MSEEIRVSSIETKGVAGKKRYAMVIDTRRCIGCMACQVACKAEFDTPLGVNRTWVPYRVVGTYPNVKKQFLPRLCNHCDDPPCAQVCPVKATYKRADGIVIVDHHRCIGCRYCMIACPYNARFFNFKENPEWTNKEHARRSHGVTESCTLCSHLLDQGRRPACVAACEGTGASAIKVGDMNVGDSEISTLVATRPVKRLREDLGTEPKVYYLKERE